MVPSALRCDEARRCARRRKNVRFGACVPSLFAPRAAQVGWEFVELDASELHPGREQAGWEETAAAVREAGIPALVVQNVLGADEPVAGLRHDLERCRGVLEATAERAVSLGAKVLTVGSGPSRRLPEDYARDRAAAEYREVVRVAGEIAAARGLSVALEPMNPTEADLLHTLAEAVEWADATGNPAVGVSADAYHMHVEGEPFRNLLLARGRLLHVQVADYGRTFPGAHGMDLWTFFTYLNHLRYEGSVSAECAWESFTHQGVWALDLMRNLSETRGEVGAAI
jgi:sugar phosphate isomerase/epimerase